MSTSQPEIPIPVIEISGYLRGEPEATKSCADKLRHALENVGFLQVVGHSVSADLQRHFIEAVAAFFALPMAEKMKLDQDLSPCNRGYDPMGIERLEELEDSSEIEQKEGFKVRHERPLGRFLAGPNQWPDRNLPGMSDFRETYMEYFEAVHQLSKIMFRLVALSLDLDEHYFDEFAADPDGGFFPIQLEFLSPHADT